jgi:hypothetical protein
LTRKGVEVDHCGACEGIWLDEGEIFYFTKKPLEPALAVIALVPPVIFTGEPWLFGGALGALMGVFMLIKVCFSYPHRFFPSATISALLKKIKVSPIRAVPCTLKGRVIGRGVPGLIWSEDFVMRDDTGIMFLDYRQPLRIWEFLFGLLRRQELQDAPVEITGWYRRSPVPYVELYTLKNLDDGKTRKCHVYYLSLILACLMITGGAAIAALSGSGWFHSPGSVWSKILKDHSTIKKDSRR